MKFIISARSGNTVNSYFCNNPTQGAKMVPFAYSMARRFDTYKDAENAVDKLKTLYKGMDCWSIEKVIE